MSSEALTGDSLAQARSRSHAKSAACMRQREKVTRGGRIASRAWEGAVERGRADGREGARVELVRETSLPESEQFSAPGGAEQDTRARVRERDGAQVLEHGRGGGPQVIITQASECAAKRTSEASGGSLLRKRRCKAVEPLH